MIFFNDPVEMEAAEMQAIRMSISMQEHFTEMLTKWRNRGYNLAMGIGIASGYATLGKIGYEGRWDYGVIGTVANIAARLCDSAQAGQILVQKRVLKKLEGLFEAESIGELSLRGLHRPVSTLNITAIKEA